MLDESIADEALDSAWNAMLLDLPAERLKVLERLHSEKANLPFEQYE